MSTSDIERLRDIPIFAELDESALQRIAQLATRSTVQPGHVLVEKGQAGSGMFVIERGRVVIELPDRELERGPGSFVGELALLTDTHRTARVQAVTEVDLIAIGRHELQQLLEDHPRMAVGMLKALAQRQVEQ